jgi:hypothetical protein
MEKYLTYARYKALGGQLEEAPFNLLEYKSQKQIDKYSFDRLIGGVPNDIKEQIEYAMMCLIDFNEQNNVKNLSSESIDGYSISYGSSSEIEKRVKALVEDLLEGLKIGNTPLTYCGDVNDYKRIYYPIS